MHNNLSSDFLTALLSTVARRLGSTDEAAHRGSVDGLELLVLLISLTVDNLLRVLARVHARRLDVDILEASPGELLLVVALDEGTSDTSRPKLEILLRLRRQGAVEHNVRNGEAATRLQDAVCLGERRVLVRTEVDDAVTDDDVDGAVGQRDLLDVALQKLDIVHLGSDGVAAREIQHLIRHVEAVRLACGSDALGGEDHVDAASGTEVKDSLTLLQLRERGRVAASERGEKSLGRHLGRLELVVQVLRDGVDAGELSRL